MHRPLAAAMAFMFGIGLVAGHAALAAGAQGITTCSGMRDYCVNGTQGRSLRGVADGACLSTYESCMKTGVWDATGSGRYGIRKTGLQKR
jgi:hypothetical protein